MAGGYAHITLVKTICGDADALDAIPSLTGNIKRALMFNLNYVELGAVSPDYPYLCLFDGNAAGWANAMHYWRTLDFVRNAVPLVWDMNFSKKDTWKCLAWLFGYTAHVVTDLTVHPVVNLKVGPYAENKRAHRVCELNQDVYIFDKLLGQEITQAEYIRDCGIRSCCDPASEDRLHPAVAELWKRCLPRVPGVRIDIEDGLAVPTAPADPYDWHRHFVAMIDGFAEEGGRLPWLARHSAEAAGLVYPEVDGVDRQYIDSLATPEGLMPYDEVFRRAQENVKDAWGQLGMALGREDKPGEFALPNGCLDTGKDEADNMIYWKEANT